MSRRSREWEEKDGMTGGRVEALDADSTMLIACQQIRVIRDAA